jgi:drug/metabolite transporter (DMT)-like permease
LAVGPRYRGFDFGPVERRVLQYTAAVDSAQGDRSRSDRRARSDPARAARSMKWKGLLAVVMGAGLLGWSAIFARWAMAGGATVLTVGFYRMLVALPGAWLLTRRCGGLGPAGGRGWALVAGAIFFLDLALWHLAMERTTAANATLLVGGLSPIWVALFSVVALGLRYRWIGWAGQLAGLGGALVLGMARGAGGGSAGASGEAIAVGASFCYAAFTLAMSRARGTLRAPQALFWMSLSCFLTFGVAALALGHPLTGYDRRACLSLMGLGLVVQLLGWWLNSWGLGYVDAPLGALGLQTQQVATLFLAAWLLDEPLRPLGLLGSALIIGGIVLVTAGAAPRRVAAAPAGR